jgi:hypothetical protein
MSSSTAPWWGTAAAATQCVGAAPCSGLAHGPARRALVEARRAAADAALREVLGDDVIASDDMVAAAGAARLAAGACTPEGRPLCAAHAALPWPDEPHLVLWRGAADRRAGHGAVAGAGRGRVRPAAQDGPAVEPCHRRVGHLRARHRQPGRLSRRQPPGPAPRGPGDRHPSAHPGRASVAAVGAAIGAPWVTDPGAAPLLSSRGWTVYPPFLERGLSSRSPLGSAARSSRTT